MVAKTSGHFKRVMTVLTHAHRVSREYDAHHVVVGLTDDGGVKAFGGAFQCPRLWLV